MTTTVWTNGFDTDAAADRALKAAARFWFVVAVIGQWAFLYYLVAFYGPSTFQGKFEIWTRNKMLLKGYVPGDTAGNLVFAAHALLAAVIAFGGALQIIPQIRERAIAFHRWNGRVFIVTALGLSLSGLYMVWVRNAVMGTGGSMAISLDGVLIIIFAVSAWRTAIARNVSAHRRWALRTYMVANGQWFTRVGYLAWAILNHGRYMGPFFRFWEFGSYLLPLAILELYLRTKDRDVASERFAMAGALVVVTLLMGLGAAGFSAFMWKTVLSKL